MHIVSPASSAPAETSHTRLRDAAQKLETQFLSKMLQSAGLGQMPDAFGGGIGEERFASLLADEQAKAMVKAGGIGLAEVIFQSMVDRENE